MHIDLLDMLQDLCDKRTAQEFKSEILAYSKIEHLNLVKFYGYLEHPEEKIIVVEYVSNGTLYDLLHGKSYVICQKVLHILVIQYSTDRK